MSFKNCISLCKLHLTENLKKKKGAIEKEPLEGAGVGAQEVPAMRHSR